MLGKTIGAVFAVLTSLGLVAWIDDEPRHSTSSSSSSTSTTTGGPSSTSSTVEVRTIDLRGDESHADTAESLRRTYDLLAKLYESRLEDRSKQLFTQAADAYREAVKIYGDGSGEKPKEAATLADVAHRLAETIERLQSLSAGKPRVSADLLPPPPARAANVRLRVTKGQQGAVQVELNEIELPREGKLLTQDLVGKPGSKQVIVREGRLLDDSIGKKHIVVREVPVTASKGEANRVFIYTPDGMKSPAETIVGHVEVNKHHETQPDQKAAATVKSAGPDSPKLGSIEVKIKELEGRLKDASPQTRTYVEAARDLYRSALRDGTAGRLERAKELIDAARALEVVPRLLERKTYEPATTRPSVTIESPRVTIERKIEMKPHSTTVTRPGKPAEVRVEVREVDPPNEDDEAKPEPTAIEGIGAMLSFEDGEARVIDLVPGGPAAKDGRLESGDRLIGVVIGDKDKKEETFEGLDAAAIVEKLRGPAGSSVKLIVIKKGSDEKAIYEIERAKVDVPKDASPLALP
jgi:hypothetical protein